MSFAGCIERRRAIGRGELSPRWRIRSPSGPIGDATEAQVLRGSLGRHSETAAAVRIANCGWLLRGRAAERIELGGEQIAGGKTEEKGVAAVNNQRRASI